MQQTYNALPNKQPIDAEIVSELDGAPYETGNTRRSVMEVRHSQWMNGLLIDLFNMIKSGEFVLAEIEKATIEPLRRLFAANRKAVTPPTPKKESFFQTPAKAG